MSEEKIIQHSANALHVLQNKGTGWRKKLREFFVEILIIVFAVSITLLLHNWNDERHEHRLEREFLAGIKSDLDSGSVDLEGAVASFQSNLDYFIKVRQQLTTHQFNAAYIDSNSWELGNTSYFVFDIGRFEAFKSSGYLRLIENQTLLKDLMTLYTITIPFQIEADHLVFDNRRRYFDEHIGPRATFILATSNDGRILASRLVDDPFFRYYIIDYSGYLRERKAQKEDLAREMKKIAADIGAELNR
jgi:hypothetical protein